MSTRQQTPSSDTNAIALRVALQTMKERCFALQRRNSILEDENKSLRHNKTNTITQQNSNGGITENFQLRLQCTEQQSQITQLSEQLSMVSTENRTLWSHLSQIAKEQDKSCIVAKDSNCTLTNEEEEVTSPRLGTNQNLIRSKTFTQHSPNPNLRLKLLPTTTTVMKDLSLDEVRLDTYEANNSRELGGGEDYAETVQSDLDFTCLHVADETTSTNDEQFDLEIKKCIQSVQELRREAMIQQEQLTITLAAHENGIGLRPCPDCVRKSQRPEMADKSLETDESLNEVKLSINPVVTLPENGLNSNIRQRPTENTSILQTSSSKQLNLIQEKIQADAVDRTCPMCGKIYTNSVSFNAFQQHVEQHFIDDSADVEASIDRNFEYVSHAVGDF